MLVDFRYSREAIALSEHRVLESLSHLVHPTVVSTYIIETSSACIFDVVRLWCLDNKVKLKVSYEDDTIQLDYLLRVCNSSRCPDFKINSTCLEALYTPGDLVKRKVCVQALELIRQS